MSKPARSARAPYVVELAAGNYYWCACGRSRRPPYCDGSHRGTATPVRVEQREPGQVSLCGCGESTCKPYCDCPELGKPGPGTRER